jgi:leucyl aminopeptidase
MLPLLKKTARIPRNASIVFITASIDSLPGSRFSAEETALLKKKSKVNGKKPIRIDKLSISYFVWITGKPKVSETHKARESSRQAGDSILPVIADQKTKEVVLWDCTGDYSLVLAFAEGLMLGNYQFLKYRKDKTAKESPLKTIAVRSPGVTGRMIEELTITCSALYTGRDMVNEPLSSVNAITLAKQFEEMGMAAGVKAEVLHKAEIETLKMGGLLAVNRGSIDPPTFTVMEYRHPHALNNKPVVLVGKGVVYDTGGLSLKPAASMIEMKSDMAGAAAVGCAITAIALAGLPVHVIGLIPCTDNRPDGNAITPGDIITMMDGTTVEVLNTDAEGRLLLADALNFAKRYNPALVIDMATLTGSAEAALGKAGMAGMHSGAERIFSKLVETGYAVHERIAQFPFWDDYSELIKGDITDLKNVGGRFAGAITAGKFLEHFTAYPWIHLDIAGPSFLDKKDSYRSSGGTGVGIRLLYHFIKEAYGLPK